MATKTSKVILASIIIVLLLWVVSAVIGARYLMSPSDGSVLSPERTGNNTMWLIIFALTTTTIWLGLVVGVLIIAWKWLSPGAGRQQPPPQT